MEEYCYCRNYLIWTSIFIIAILILPGCDVFKTDGEISEELTSEQIALDDLKEQVETQPSETVPEQLNVQPLEKGVLPEAEEVPEPDEIPEHANAPPLE